MQWHAHQNGDERIRNHFCLLPFKHKDRWYWLEYIVLRERFVLCMGDSYWIIEEVMT
jgi:hypothetical protein